MLAAWVAITVNFAIPRLMPGNAIDTMLTKFPTLDASSLKALEAEFGTRAHGSLLSQYVSYLGNLAHGNLGLSVQQYPAKVTTILAQTQPWTLILVGTATILSFALETLLGVVAAWPRRLAVRSSELDRPADGLGRSPDGPRPPTKGRSSSCPALRGRWMFRPVRIRR